MQIIWSARATQNLNVIVEYIARDNLDAALALDEHIRNAADGLTLFPRKGWPGRVPGTREMVVHANYVVVYATTAEAVYIVAVLHAALPWPRLGD